MARRKQAPEPERLASELNPNRVFSRRFRTPLGECRCWFKGSPIPYRILDERNVIIPREECPKEWDRIMSYT